MLQGILMFLGVGIVILQVQPMFEINEINDELKQILLLQGVVELGGFSEVIRITDEGGRLKLLK